MVVNPAHGVEDEIERIFAREIEKQLAEQAVKYQTVISKKDSLINEKDSLIRACLKIFCFEKAGIGA